MDAAKSVLRVLTAVSLGACVAAATAAGAAYRSDMRTARARLAGQSRRILTASGPAEVAEAGSGPPALVVHGSAGGFDMGMQVGRDVLGDGYRIIAPSRFGYLGTPMPSDASHAHQAAAFASLLDTLDLPSVVVVAVSAGAQAATQLALLHPDRVQALVLITPALYLPLSPEELAGGPPSFIFDHLLASDRLVWTLARLAPKLLVRVAGVPRSLDDRVTANDREKLVDWFFPASARHVGLAHDIRTTTPVAPDLPIEQLQMPVMLVSAVDDPYRTADVVRYSAERLRTVRVLMCDSGGHVLLGQEARVRREVQDFLGAVEHDEKQEHHLPAGARTGM